MLKASSLFYAVIISLIIALLSSSLILFFCLNKTTINNYLMTEKLDRNSWSGMNILLSNNHLVPVGEKITFDLFHQFLNSQDEGKSPGNDSISLEYKAWGAFDIGISKSFWKNGNALQIALIGCPMFPWIKKLEGLGIHENVRPEDIAIYLRDQGKALSLCGNTIIKGTCYLPKSGVERSYIEGTQFSENKLILGEIKTSFKILPLLNPKLFQWICSMQNNDSYISDSLIKINHIKIKDTIINSFQNKTLILFSTETILLDNKFYKGNIIIFSKEEIQVRGSIKLQDVILIAPRIKLRENFSGSLQAFAFDTLLVENKCNLIYPSVLSITSTKNQNASLIMKEDSKLNGIVIAYQNEASSGMGRKEIMINIEKGSSIEGHIYSNGLVDFKGSLNGTIICDGFILSTTSSVYENQLLNVCIDATKLSKHFVGIDIFGFSEEKSVVKWMY